MVALSARLTQFHKYGAYKYWVESVVCSSLHLFPVLRSGS